MENKENNLFIYWIGKEYKLIKILRNLIYLHSTNGNGYKVHLINHSNIKNYLDNIPEYFYKLCPAHQADYVRVCIVLKYGGIWLDSDTLVLNSLDCLFNLVNNKNGFFIRENNQIIWNGIFGSKSNTDLLKEWENRMETILNAKKEKIGWTEIGNHLLQEMFNQNKKLFDEYEIFDGLDNMYPVNWNNCVNEYLKKPFDNYKKIIRSFQPLIVLVNSVYKELENKTEKEIFEAKLPLNYFISKSFENNKKIIYLKIAKNMGTSFTSYLQKHNNYYGEIYDKNKYDEELFYKSKIITIGHENTIKYFKEKYEKIFNNSYKIIILREPLDRLYSSYSYLKLNKPFIHYFNIIKNKTEIIKKSDYENNNHHYVHFEITQTKSCDINNDYVNDVSYIFINMNNINYEENDKLKNIGLQEYKIEHLNKSKRTNKNLSKDENDLFYQIFVEDIQLYNKLFVK